MAVDFDPSSIRHTLSAQFVPATLPTAEEPYNLKAVSQTRYNVHDLVSLAVETYNLKSDAKMLEEDFLTLCRVIFQVMSEGGIVETPLGIFSTKLPGVYKGTETDLKAGHVPEARILVSPEMRRFVAAVKVAIVGFMETNGFIAEAVDLATGKVDEVMTIGDVVEMLGVGIKIESTPEWASHCGLFLVRPGQTAVRVVRIIDNTPRKITFLVPPGVTAGQEYTLQIVTMSSAKSPGVLLKNYRSMRSDFKLTAQAAAPQNGGADTGADSPSAPAGQESA
jgi:hypothetical protein